MNKYQFTKGYKEFDEEAISAQAAGEELEDAEKHGVRERKEANSEPTPRGKPSLGLFTSDFPPCGCAPTPKM
jgi:hypothetical protein